MYRSMKRGRVVAKDSSNKKPRFAKAMVKPTLQRAINKILARKVEVKEYSQFASGVAVITSGSIITLNNDIAEGTEYNQRVGRHISTKQIQVDFTVQSTGTAPYSDSGQVLLVYDSQPNASSVAYSDIQDLSESATAGSTFRNTITYGDRFKVAWVDDYAVGSAGPLTYKCRKFFAVPPNIAEVEFNASGDATPTKGAWYLLFGSDFNSATSTKINYNIKYQYTDM